MKSLLSLILITLSLNLFAYNQECVDKYYAKSFWNSSNSDDLLGLEDARFIKSAIENAEVVTPDSAIAREEISVAGLCRQVSLSSVKDLAYSIYSSQTAFSAINFKGEDLLMFFVVKPTVKEDMAGGEDCLGKQDRLLKAVRKYGKDNSHSKTNYDSDNKVYTQIFNEDLAPHKRKLLLVSNEYGRYLLSLRKVSDFAHQNILCVHELK